MIKIAFIDLAQVLHSILMYTDRLSPKLLIIGTILKIKQYKGMVNLQQQERWHTYLLHCAFILLLFACCAALLWRELPAGAQLLYLVFGSTLGCSYFLTSKPLKISFSLVSFAAIFFVGHWYVQDIEAIEEIYHFIPLLFLMVFPGTFYPLVAAFALTSAYSHSIGHAPLVDIVEDSFELVLVTAFACTMSYFHQQAKRQMTQFRQESYTDYLTGLKNRKSYRESIAHLQHQLQDNPLQQFALLSIDLDGFKKINDQLGHVVGDQALKQVARRLELLCEKHCELFRLSGDEFAFLLMSDSNVTPSAMQLAENIIALAEQPYELEHKDYFMSSSIGIAIFPRDASDSESLTIRSDLAMYKAKAEGKNTYAFYSKDLTEKTIRQHELEADLKLAVQKQQLTLHYQPKVCIETNQIFSAEALIRWHHPKYGFISPLEFIPIAEASGDICDIGYWIAKQACQDFTKFKTLSTISSIAINVSTKQLTDTGFVKKLNDIIAAQGCMPKWIELEQTESALMDSQQTHVNVMSQLKQCGYTLALDDFGTYYSSLSQLTSLPLHTLKIDKSFIDHCTENKKSHMIVRTIIQLADNLGLQTIAEGVESAEQLALLRAEGCMAFQGYYFSKPLPAKDFIKLLEQNQKR